jgi:signal transduction histidine kinase
VDAWLNRTYERRGPVYVVLAVAAIGAVICLVIGPIALAGASRFEGLSIGEYLVCLAASWAATAIAFPLLVTWAGELRILLRWGLQRGRSPLDPRVARAAFTGPRKSMVPTAVCAGGLVGPVTVVSLTLQSGHTTMADFVGLGVGALLSILLAMVALYAGVELALRPVRAHVSRDGFSVAPVGSLGTNLLLGLLALTFAASCLIGTARVTRAHDGPGSVIGVYAIALAITAVSGSVLAPLLAASVLGPVRDLIAGTRGVADGDLATVVPVTSNDELGELALKFNEMVSDLRRKSEDLRASQARIVASSDAARRKVERDLHDGAQQQLVLAKIKLAALERLLTATPTAAVLAAELRGDLDRALSELRDLARGLYPPLLEAEGLGPALSEALSRCAIPASLDCDGVARYRPELEAAVYFCCLEALQNSAKHGGDGARARVRLCHGDETLTFEISDDGAGFDCSVADTSSGIQNMADRIGALGGQLRVGSKPGRGTKVVGVVPTGAS